MSLVMNSEFCVHEGRSAYVRSSRTAWHKKNIFTGGERRFQNSRTMRICHFSFFPFSRPPTEFVRAPPTYYSYDITYHSMQPPAGKQRVSKRRRGTPTEHWEFREPTTITIHRQTTSKSLVLHIVVNGSFSDTGTIVTYQILNIWGMKASPHS